MARVACASDLRAATWRQAFVETDALHKAALEAAAFAVRYLGCISAASRSHLDCISAASQLYLGCISTVSRLHLGCISAVSRLYLGR